MKRLVARSWIGALLLAAGFLVWSDGTQVRRAEYVTSLAREELAVTPDSPTGYAGGTRELIVPEHLAACYGWIAETQQMFARREWRVRATAAENAPFGRPVHHASPYRWWLGLIAWIDHAITGRPVGLAVERAALVADPLLHLLLLIATTGLVARHFGALPASVTAFGMVTLFPFAAGFLPAVPEDYAFVLVLTLGSLLALVIGLRAVPTGVGPPALHDPHRSGRAERWFLIAGIAGGLGCWIDVGFAVPVQLGIGGGALLAAWLMRVRRDATADARELVPPWRLWALGGAGTILVAYLLEYFPEHLGNWELRVMHPLHGVAWLGGGELLARAVAGIQHAGRPRRRADWVVLPLALAALAALPIAMWKLGNAGFLTIDLLSFRLTKQVDAVLAPGLMPWLVRDGVTASAAATLLVLLLLVAAVGLALRRGSASWERAALLLLCGPALVALWMATIRLRWWQTLDAILLVQAALVTLTLSRAPAPVLRTGWLLLLAAVGGAGLFQLIPGRSQAARDELSLAEVEGLVERDLAHWLARHVAAPAQAIVLAPPDLTAALDFYGGLRGVATLSWENKDGLSVALRIVIATAQREAEALVNHRGITHLVIPSWDRFYEEYSRPAGVQAGEMLYDTLHRGAFPAWLRPMPFQLPRINGFERQSVLILQVVDEQDGPSAASHLAEYDVEMGRLSDARAMGEVLRRFPSDLGALVARAQVAFALRDAATFPGLLDTIVQRVAAGADRFLPWDRRVSLAVVLARGRRMDLARVQVERCLADATAPRLRSLTGYALFHLEWLRQSFGLEIRAPELRALIHDLLPPGAAGAASAAP